MYSAEEQEEAVMDAMKQVCSLFGSEKEFRDYVKARKLERTKGKKAERNTDEKQFATIKTIACYSGAIVRFSIS